MINNQPLSYRADALRELTSMLHIPPTRISKMLGQTNNITVNRWLGGCDIYVNALVNLCNMLQLDLLSFFTYNGQPLQTSLADIIRLEQSGLNLRQILEEKGVNPATEQESHTLPTEPHSSPTPTQPNIQSLPTELLDRMIAIQCQAHEHERQMLEQQRADMQTIIDDKDKQIAKLEKELKRLRVIERASKPYMGIVADDGEQ